MNVVVNSQLLATELRLLNKVVPQKPAIAILSHALFEADAEGFHLYATDMEVGLSTHCDGHVAEVGKVALPVAKFLALIEQFPDDDVTIATDGKNASVACGAFRSRLQAMPTTDFPQPPVVEGTSCVIGAAALGQMIDRTRYAVNATASMATMKGALLTLVGEVAAMVTTDSKRLAMTTFSRVGPDVKVIVPVKTLDAIAGQLTGGDVELTLGRRHLFLTFGGRTYASRTIDGQYPAYERIVPMANDKVVVVDRLALIGALKRIILVSEENRATYFDILDTANAIELTSQSAEVGSAAEVVAARYDGERLKICVNGQYVLDFLNAASGQTIELKLKDAKGAMLLMDGVDHLSVVMLMRV